MISSDLANSFIVILKFINNIINGKEIDDLTTIDPKTKYALSIKIVVFTGLRKEKKINKRLVMIMMMMVFLLLLLI